MPLPARFHSRLLANNLDCAVLSSICHSLVATGSSHPKILASQRILAVLTPLLIFLKPKLHRSQIDSNRIGINLWKSPLQEAQASMDLQETRPRPAADQHLPPPTV
jgi:hypothetical protein